MVENPLEQVEILRKVQDIDSQIKEFEIAKGDIPQRLAEMEAARSRDRADINTAQQKLQVLEQDRARLEKEIAFDRESFKTFEEKIKQVDSTEAAEAAAREVENRKKVIRGKEEDVLRLMEEVETIQKKIAQLEEDFSAIGEKYAEQEAELKKRVGEIEGDTKDLRAQRDALTVDLEKSLLRKYEQIFQRRDGLAIVPVVSEVCQGCFMGVPPQIVNDARAGREGVQVCPNCHRIIFWQPVDAPTE